MSLAVNGWVKFPSGLIIQWFSGPLEAGELAAYPTLNFPIAFPNVCLNAFVATQSTGLINDDFMFQLVSFTKTTIKVFPQKLHSDAKSGKTNPVIFAIGH